MPGFFATCPRGLEPLLADELAACGAAGVQACPGGVAFAGDWATCYRVNLQSRMATRVLWRVKAPTRYRNEEEVYRAVYELPWPRWFDVKHTILVKVTAIKSPLKSLGFITLRIKDAVCDRFRAEKGARPDVAKRDPDLRIHAFFGHDQFTLYLDTSGDALYKRGTRRHANIAPLCENLAAGILRLTGWQPGTPLLDPMCGGGTFLMEAAQIALNIPPGMGRRFAFEKLGNFDRALWQAMREAAIAAQQPVQALPIYGSDLDAATLRAARRNLEAAGLGSAVHLRQSDVLDVVPPAPAGILVANLPYGERMGDKAALAALYPELGNVLKKRFSGWKVWLLTADLSILKLMRLAPSRRIPLYNGAIECRLLEYRMVAGSNRAKKCAVSDGV